MYDVRLVNERGTGRVVARFGALGHVLSVGMTRDLAIIMEVRDAIRSSSVALVRHDVCR